LRRRDIIPLRDSAGRAAALLIVLIAGLALGLAAGRFLWSGRKPEPGARAGSEAPHGAEGAGASAGLKRLYTCGMHPEVIQDEPGNCPKCGMKLIPMDPDRARLILEARGEAPSESAGPAKERKILYWRSSMDPAYVRSEPGKDAMGMDLVPVYEDEVRGGPTIRIDPVTEQNMGLRYDVARLGPVEKTVRTVAMVKYDEQGLGSVTVKVDGWVEKVHVDQTGAQVHKGDPLFEFYSPQLYSAQEEFLAALRDLSGAQGAGGEASRMARSRLESARDRLRLFDIAEKQISELETGKAIRKTLAIESKLTGIVTEKRVVEGDYLMAGAAAYKIADLSNVWVVGKVFESDAPYIRLGQEAFMTLDYLPGRTYKGRVTYIYPYLEEATREIPVRVEFHNPGYDLKPGMYATMEIKSRLADQAVLVPDTAVIDTGKRQVAFVSREPGKFELREVTIGARTGANELQALSGLAPGERVVVSGQFLLDSESRLREAALKMLQPGLVATAKALSPQSGPAAGPEEMRMSHGEGETASQPASQPSPPLLRYVCPMPSHAGILYNAAGDCPLCGMRLVPVQAWQEQGSPVAYYTCPMPEHSEVHEAKPGKCPLCGMTLIPVTEQEAARFKQVEPGQAPPTLYTCPMPADADVVSDRPGNCPKCGMELVPTSSVPHGKQAEEHWRAEHSASQPAGPEPKKSSEEGMSMPM